MKKIYSFLAVAAISFVAYSQTAQTIIAEYAVNPLDEHIATPGNTALQAGTIDTIDDYLLRASTLVMVTAQAGGYVFGTGWQDFGPPFGVQKLTSECGNHYSSIGNAKVTEVLAFFGATVIIGTADSVSANVYVAGADSMPTTLLASGKKSTGDIILNNLTSIPVSGSNITGDFFVSMSYSGIDDTIGIICNNPNSNDGNGEKRTRIKLAAAPQWLTADAAFGGFDADVMIIPVVDIQSGINNVEINEIKVLGSYPNPASEETRIKVFLETARNLSITIFDVSGRIIYSETMSLERGEKSITVSTSVLTGGNYYYTISSGEYSVTSKFTVIK